MPKPKWRKKGRNRLPGPRTASGRRIPDPVIEIDKEDKGHPVTQAHRQWLAQRWIETTDPKTGKTTTEIIMGDVTRTTYPLGVLLNSGTIDRQQHDAGCKYARLYAGVAGRVSPPAIILDDDRSGRAPEDDEQREKRRVADEQLLKDAASALHDVGSKAKSIVDNVSVYSRFPRWMFPVRPRVSDVREADALIAGLEALARCFGYRRERKVA